jgi:hypothetical protein
MDLQQLKTMKKTFTHTTKCCRSPLPVSVFTLTSESGQMRLTTTQETLQGYELGELGRVGAIGEMASIPDETFGKMLTFLLEEGMLEREYINE